MLKIREKYTDFLGNEREEDLYFNLTTAELTEWEIGVDGGMSALIKKVVDTKDVPAISRYFKELICKSYGEVSADGKRFIKSKEITDAFTQTVAYSNIYMRLLDADEAIKFIKGIIPADLSDKISDVDLKKAQANVESLNKEN